MKPIKDPLGISPSKGNQGTTRGNKGKILLTSVGIEPTTSERSTVTLPTELRERTGKVGDDLGGESRRREIRVHMNVVLRSTMNTNGGTVHLIRRSWIRFPPRSKEFFLYLVWLPDSLY